MGGAPRAVLGAEVTWQSGWAVSRPRPGPRTGCHCVPSPGAGVWRKSGAQRRFGSADE